MRLELTRLMDIGLERLKNMTLDMARLSEKTVSTAIDAYKEGQNVTEQIFRWSDELRILQDEVSDLAIEVIARYQPVASDLRLIKSCMEISYGFSRFGRYAYDISQVLGIFSDISMCNKTSIEDAGKQVKKIIKVSINAFAEQNIDLARSLSKMDEVVDKIYLDFVKNAAKAPDVDLKCALSGTLILRYLERIADHATYIGDSVIYIVSGERSSRK